MARTLRQAMIAHRSFSTGREGVRMVEQGCINVNGQRATSSLMLIWPGDVVTFGRSVLFTEVDTSGAKE